MASFNDEKELNKISLVVEEESSKARNTDENKGRILIGAFNL